ncbi:hypothetical protein E1N00_01165, partial [Staphylococcus epidermidis]
VTAQRAENIQKKYKKDNFYIISIEIVFFHLSRYFMSRTRTLLPVLYLFNWYALRCLIAFRNLLSYLGVVFIFSNQIYKMYIVFLVV